METIYTYKNYRKFVEDFYLAKKSEGSFTLDSFAKLAGFKSRSYFKSIFEGTRNLNSESIFKVAKAMDLNLSEQQYFENLVYENQSDLQEQKLYYKRTLSKFRKNSSISKTKELGLLDYPFFLSALTLLSDHSEGITAERFTTLLKLKNSDANKFLAQMVESKVIRQVKDLYFYNKAHTVFHDSKDWPLKQREFLLNQIRQGLHKVEKSYDKSKAYSQVFLGRSQSIKVYQQLVLDLLNELAEQETEYDSETTKLFQINLQIFEAL